MAISQARFKEVVCYSSIALLALAITAGPWVITVALQAPDYWNYFFWVEHVQRFIAKESARSQPTWFYIPIVILGVLPWLGFLFGALKSAFSLKKVHSIFCCGLLSFLLFSQPQKENY